jgi:hypothetical protein
MFKNVTIQEVYNFYACFGVKMWYHWQNIFKKIPSIPIFWHFSMRKPDKTARPDKDTTPKPPVPDYPTLLY